jgi:hypothetical protein
MDDARSRRSGRSPIGRPGEAPGCSRILRVVRQRLLDYGLTTEETIKRLGTLSDEQVHQFAAHMDTVQAGGDVVGDVIVILLIVVIVIAILEVTGHHIIIRR